MTTNARANDPPTPAPMPIRAPLDDDEDVPEEMEEPLYVDDDVAARDVVVKAAVVFTVTEAAAAFVVLRLGLRDVVVEPDVGSNMTGPASMENGVLLFLVLLIQLLVAGSA